MSRVSVVYDGVFAEIAGCHGETVVCAGDSLRHVVEALSARYGQRFRDSVLDPVTRDIVVATSVLVNGRRRGISEPLSDGDEVAFLMPFPGG